MSWRNNASFKKVLLKNTNGRDDKINTLYIVSLNDFALITNGINLVNCSSRGVEVMWKKKTAGDDTFGEL